MSALQAQFAKSQLKEMRDKVNKNKASAKQPPQAPPQSLPQGLPPVHSPLLVPQGPYPGPPPYFPYPQVVIQNFTKLTNTKQISLIPEYETRQTKQ